MDRRARCRCRRQVVHRSSTWDVGNQAGPRLHLRRRRIAMPKLTVQDVGTFDVPDKKRLVNALEDEAKIDQMHACGGNARCTTCRVEFVSGEPEKMTEA